MAKWYERARDTVARNGRRIDLGAMLLAGSLVPLAMSSLQAGAAEAVPQTLDFDIMRAGDLIGHHRVTFHEDGDRLLVHSELKIEVKVLFLTVYRYQQTRDEVWRNGKIVALASTADDDGTPRTIKGAAGPSGIRVTSGNDSWTLPVDSVPASFWNMSMVTAKGPLVDSLSGKVVAERVVNLGQETVSAGGRDITAAHYRLEAKRPRDVWYDESGRWVKMRMIGRDGSAAEWVLK